MEDKLAKIDASPEDKGDQNDLMSGIPKTVEEFDALLVKYKKQSPKQYAKKEKKGEFDRFRAKLGGKKVKSKEEKKEEPKEEKKVVEKKKK